MGKIIPKQDDPDVSAHNLGITELVVEVKFLIFQCK